MKIMERSTKSVKWRKAMIEYITKTTENLMIETNSQTGFVQKKTDDGYEIIWDDGFEEVWSESDIESCCGLTTANYWWSLYKDSPPDSAIVKLETGEFLLKRFNEQDIIYEIEVI